jgi:hypothetical protein
MAFIRIETLEALAEADGFRLGFRRDAACLRRAEADAEEEEETRDRKVRQ